MIKFISDLRQVGGWFSPGLPVSSTNKTDRHDITEILLKVALNKIKPNLAKLIIIIYNKPFQCETILYRDSTHANYI